MANNNNINIKITDNAKMSRESLHNLSKSFVSLSKDGKIANTSLTGLAGSLGVLKKAITGVGLYKLSQGLTNATQSAMDMRESIHLYNTAMGEFAESTGVAIDKLSRLSGMDRIKIADTVGEFNLLARSMGLTSENASVLSENTNRLALDLGSLTNRSFKKVSEDLRSGLIGQSKTMYKYGIDVTESALKQEALNQGIEKSVRHMSQGEKMALRYSVMIRQSALSHGDFAKTIDAPANQLRVFSDRMLTLSRSLGSIFIPMLTRVLPYLNAFAQALINIVNAFAKLVGYDKMTAEAFENTSNGFGGIAEDIQDVGTDSKGAGGQVDKLKKKLQALAGFDEINVLGTKTPESPPVGGSSGVGGAGGGSGGGALGGYDSLIDSMSQKSDELVGKIQEKLEAVLELVKLIGIAFLSWKIAGGILSFLNGGLLTGGLLKAIQAIGVELGLLGPKGLSAQAVLAGVIAVMIGRFLDLYKNSELFRKGLTAIKDTGKNALEFIVEKLKSVGNWFVDLGIKMANALPDNWKIPIVSGIEAIQKVAGALDLDWKDLLITLGGIGLLASPFSPLGKALLIFEALTIAVRAIGYGASDAIDEIDFFANGVSQATIDKLEPFREKLNALNDTLLTISWGNMVMDEATINDIKTKLSEVTQFIIKELDSDQNEALSKLAPLKKALGEEAYAELILANKEYYDGMRESVLADEQAINDIIAEAQKDGGILTQEHYDEINKIQERMGEVGIKHIAETEIEYTKIMDTLSDNAQRISLEQASGIIKNSLETKEKTIDDARTQYSTIKLEADRMLEVGAINDEQYKNIMDSAKETKEKTIKDAEEQYDNIHKTAVNGLGETGKYLDKETGDIKSKWEVWTEDLYKSVDENTTKMRENIQEWGKKVDKSVEDTKKAVVDYFSSMGETIKEDWDETLKSTKDALDYWKTKFGELWEDIKKLASDKWDSIKTSADTKWASIKKAMLDPIEDAKDKISEWIDDIKGFFSNMKLKIPKIELPSLPKFELEGKFDLKTLSVPRLSTKWNAKGGFMDSATIFGGSGNTAFGGGEAGGEGIVPLEGKHMMPLADAIANRLSDVLARQTKATDVDGGIIIQIGERTILDTLTQGVNRETRINGKSVIRV